MTYIELFVDESEATSDLLYGEVRKFIFGYEVLAFHLDDVDSE